MIIQTDHSAIIDIIQQWLITSITSTMRLNLRLVRASQFLQQFKLDVCHKPGKELIIPDAFNRLASINTCHADPHHSEFNTLFTYNAMLVEIHPVLVSRILAGYKADPWWARLQQQVQTNADLRADEATLPFVIDSVPSTNSDPYLGPQPDSGENTLPASLSIGVVPKGLPAPDKSQLLFYINRLTNVHRLYIPPSVAPDILTIAHGKGHPGFSRCYEIITCSWFIHDLTKLLRTFICYSSQCFALQTRRHTPYGSLQPIESPPVLFFTLNSGLYACIPVVQKRI